MARRRKPLTIDDVLNIVLRIDVADASQLTPGMFRLCQEALATITNRHVEKKPPVVAKMPRNPMTYREKDLKGRFLAKELDTCH